MSDLRKSAVFDTPRLAIIVPSRGRPKNVERLLDLGDGKCTDWYFCVDNDDTTARAYHAIVVPSRERLLNYPSGHRVEQQGNRTLITGPSQRLVPWLNWVSAQLLNEYRCIGFIGDDHLPRTPRWDTRITEALQRLGSGIVYTNDLLQSEKLPTVAFLTSDIIRALGFMAPPTLVHMFVDNFWLDLGRAIQRIKYLGDVVIEHLHPVAGKADIDDGYRTAMAATNGDAQTYQRYRIDQFPHDVERVQKMIAGTEEEIWR